MRGAGPHFPVLDEVRQYDSAPGYVVFTMPSPKRVRVQVDDAVIADSLEALLLFESEHLPVYYFPLKDVRQNYLIESAKTTTCPFKGTASYYTISTGDRVIEDAVWRYRAPIPGCPPIGEHVAFYWDKMSHWFEEDEEVFVHARDPFHRVDILPSSRHVQVTVGGQTVADSRRAMFLFETGLPARYYLPIADTRLEALAPSQHHTRCPYKGIASYFHLTVDGKRHDDLVWYYPDPVEEAARIKGLVCFYNERVDRILIDRVEQPTVTTAWSRAK
jgi:uncharacterized protein (DUF427 family)